MVVGEISQERDLVIIGGGPGGYTAAIRAAQLGLEVTLIEQAELGGSCLHKACIPSKIWTHTAKKNMELNQLSELGFELEGRAFRLEKLFSYKEKIIAQLQKGVTALCAANKIEVLTGKAIFIADDRLGVENGHQFDIYIFKHAIIATGSSPVYPASLTHSKLSEARQSQEHKRVVLAEGIFGLRELPEHLLVYGRDYLSLEVASSFAALGSKVSLLLENEADFSFDASINKELQRLFKKRKIRLFKEATLQAVEETGQGISVIFSTPKQAEEQIKGSHLFLSGVRKANLADVSIERFGIGLTEEGFIAVNQHLQTSIPSIYAIGDVTGNPFLAAKAIKQGKVVAEVLAGEHPELDLTFLPTIVHTHPPIASVGLTEADSANYGIRTRISQIPLGTSGSLLLSGQKEGLLKVISDASNGMILGVHMLGAGAVELASHFTQLLEMAAREEDVIFPIYAHPSISESLLEAVEELSGLAIHLPPQP